MFSQRNAMHKFKIAAVALSLATTAAYADVVVVVAAKSSVTSMTPEQVSKIFLGKDDKFPNGEKAIPVDQFEGAAARNEFYTKVAGKDASQLKAYWSNLLFSGSSAIKPPKMVPDSDIVKKVVAGTPGQIGYINKEAVDSSVKVVLTP